MRPELFAAIYHCNKGFALRLSAKAPFLHFPCRTQAGCRLLRSLGEAPAPAVAAAGDDAHVALAFGACAANLLGITDERARDLEPIALVKLRRRLDAAAEDSEPAPAGSDAPASPRTSEAAAPSGASTVSAITPASFTNNTSTRMIPPFEKPSAAVSEGLRSRVKSLTIQDCRAVCTKRTPTVRKQDDKNQKNAIQENKRNIMALIQNKRARHDYAIEEKFEAGIVLQGWEVKSVRASRAQINLAHIYVRDGELFLCNAHMTPADQACTHVTLESNERESSSCTAARS